MTSEACSWSAGTVLTVEIGDVAYGGVGVGRVDGKVVMAHGLLPGERAEVRVVRDHGRYAQCEAVRLLSLSPQRVEPACPLALRVGTEAAAAAVAVCPGCRYQHATYEAEVSLKVGQLRALLARQGRQPDVNVPPAVASPTPLGYRNKIVLHTSSVLPPGSPSVLPSSDLTMPAQLSVLPSSPPPAGGEASPPQGAGVLPSPAQPAAPALGYYAEDNTTVVDVARCPLAVDPINALLAEVRAAPDALAGVRDGGAVTFRHTAHDGAMWWPGAAPAEGGGSREPGAGGDEAGDLLEDSPVGLLAVPRGSFFQVNPAVADRLVREVVARVAAEPPETLVDLFCGVGVFALAAAKAGPRTVFGIDSDPRAIRAAGCNAAALKIGNVRWLRAAAGPGLRQVRPMVGGRTAVIVDPPRSGLGRGLVRDLAALRPDRILYVSCAADTLARDAAWFLEHGYRVASATLFDMFPRTAHFETLADLRPV